MTPPSCGFVYSARPVMPFSVAFCDLVSCYFADLLANLLNLCTMPARMSPGSSGSLLPEVMGNRIVLDTWEPDRCHATVLTENLMLVTSFVVFEGVIRMDISALA